MNDNLMHKTMKDLNAKTFTFERDNGLTIVVESKQEDSTRGRLWNDEITLIKDGRRFEVKSLDRFSPEESAFYCKEFAQAIGAPLNQRFNVRDLFKPVFDYKREIRARDGKRYDEMQAEWKRQQEIIAL